MESKSKHYDMGEFKSYTEEAETFHKKSYDEFDIPKSDEILKSVDIPQKNEIPNVVNQVCQEDLISSFSKKEADGVEIIFAFDTTGSMSGAIAQVRSQVTQTCETLMKNIKNLKIGIMAIGDYCDAQSSYALKTCDLTSNVKKITSFIKDVPNSGGGDEPECYELALYEAARNVKWSSKDSIAKALVMIGDAMPHPPQYTTEKIDWKKELSTLVKKDIKIYGVVCNGSPTARPFYEIIAKKKVDVCALTLHNFR